MHLRSDVVGDEANDPLAVGRRQSLTRVGQTLSQPVDPEATVWVQHHLDDGGVFEPAGNRWPQRGAQHAGAAGDRFCPQ
jgi:hypothetical protein